MTDDNNCKHEGCMCARTQDSDYCSQYCEDAESGDITEIACECGHPACEQMAI